MKIVHIYGVPYGVCFATWTDYIMFNQDKPTISANTYNFLNAETLKISFLKYIISHYHDLWSSSWALGCWAPFS